MVGPVRVEKLSGYVAVALVVVLAACGGADSGGSGPLGVDAVMASMPGGPVPFRAVFTITSQVVPPGAAGYPARCPTGPTNAAAVATGAGQATHLGRIMETESDCIDFATLLLTQGEMTLTSANGDRVWAEFEGSASRDPPPPNANLACTWRIIGGSGRFTGARGAGACVDSRQLGDGRSLIDLRGWIGYEASRASEGLVASALAVQPGTR
ncbi:MAG: hypothetical protein PVH00_04385 [Gemmatimonadota bacterium]|jgi:hypothetical protein